MQNPIFHQSIPIEEQHAPLPAKFMKCISKNSMFTDGNRQAKQKFRRQRIRLSRIFVTNDGKQLEPDWDIDF